MSVNSVEVASLNESEVITNTGRKELEVNFSQRKNLQIHSFTDGLSNQNESECD
jgi:hypothetical protein